MFLPSNTITLRAVQGDTIYYRMEFTQDGVPFNLTDVGAIKMTFKNQPTDLAADAVLSLALGSGIVIENAVGGVATAEIPSDANILPARAYYFDVQVETETGEISTAISGRIMFDYSITGP